MLDLLIYKVDHAHAASKFADAFVVIAGVNTMFSLQVWEQTIIFALTGIYMVYRVLNERHAYRKNRPGQRRWRLFKKAIKKAEL